MAKRRKGNHEEVMLIPFLDILCSLIGILVLSDSNTFTD
jgi:hypothetical protein